MVDIKKLTYYARNSVDEIGEMSGINSAGKCKEISELILKKIHYYELGKAELFKPAMFINGGFSDGGHVVVLMPQDMLIIDTQLWQYVGNKVKVNKRKVVFGYKEYEDKLLKVK